jgi:hypothetical protein
MAGARRRARLSAWVVAIVLATASIAGARRSAAPPSIGAMARSAARVFRGQCTGVAVETATIGGARIAVTAYTFRVGEHLKGDARSSVTFRQVGTPAGGPRDLGALVGLPVFAPGTEYVLFLLPEGRAGMTSPAGAGDGAFVVRDGEVASVRGAGAPGAAAAAPAVRTRATSRAGESEDEPRSYEALRRAVLDELAK